MAQFLWEAPWAFLVLAWATGLTPVAPSPFAASASEFQIAGLLAFGSLALRAVVSLFLY